MLKLAKQISFWLVITLLVFAAFMVTSFIQFQQQKISTVYGEPLRFVIQPGSSIKSIANLLVDAEIIRDAWMFILLVKFEGVERQIKAGEYEIKNDQTVAQLLQAFRNGNSIQYQFTIIEGWTFKQLLQALKGNDVLLQTLQQKTPKNIMAMLGHSQQHPEGQFFPDTYHFPKGTSDLDFLGRAYRQMQAHLQQEWLQRDSNLPLQTPEEALILASIIEKETGRAFERPLIAAAFIRRLRKNMRLQTDPTVIYGLGDDYKGDIRFKHLKQDTPYNTYIHRGLTPTPIAMPGLDSIKAALHPADSQAIFFVSKGDGTHYFSETLEQHNKAVIKYQLKGRKPKRKASTGE